MTIFNTLPAWRCFNPRPPRGGRRPGLWSGCCLHLVSIHAPRAGGDAPRHHTCTTNPLFQSTPPARGATEPDFRGDSNAKVSIHAPRAGGDPGGQQVPHCGSCFNPRPPRGGRRIVKAPPVFEFMFQSTPPARGATSAFRKSWSQVFVSIHAPRAGGDVIKLNIRNDHVSFNPRPPRGGRHGTFSVAPVGKLVSIHAPRAGGDKEPACLFNGFSVFQSTPPARGATIQAWMISRQ